MIGTSDPSCIFCRIVERRAPALAGPVADAAGAPRTEIAVDGTALRTRMCTSFRSSAEATSIRVVSYRVASWNSMKRQFASGQRLLQPGFDAALELPGLDGASTEADLIGWWVAKHFKESWGGQPQ